MEGNPRLKKSENNGDCLYSETCTINGEEPDRGTPTIMDGNCSVRHVGGRMKKINAWYLNTHMVYL